MRLFAPLFLIIFLPLCAQQSQPDVSAQKAAMKKLDFLTGKWTGDVLVWRGPGEPRKIAQTEEIQFKLDGLVLLLEGTGRDAAGNVSFRALATIAYDEPTRTYRFRSYNDGRYLDTELKLTDSGYEWSHPAGPGRVRYTMRLTGGEWKEIGELVVGSDPPRKLVELTVHRAQ